MTTKNEISLRFGPFELLPGRVQLLKNGDPVLLGSRALAILVVLANRGGELVSNSEILASVWPNTFVEEANLRVHLTAVRRALGDGQGNSRYIQNVPGRGYRFVAPIARHDQQANAVASLIDPVTEPRLPPPLTRLIGRSDAVDAVIDQLQRRQFVTIVGAAGVGKTTVALAAAWETVNRYPDGSFFVDLAPLDDTTLVPSAVATALQLPVFSKDLIPELIRFLREKRALIVLDNCEHAVTEAALLAEALLSRAPTLHILATSREPLRASGEWVHRLRPLDIPEELANLTAADALTFPALQLFAERALAILGTFELTDADAPHLADLCRKLDGIPLAIELAAARVDHFGISGLVAHLDDQLSILTRGRRTALPHHQTLRATLDWSYHVLPSEEQAVLGRLAVFRGRFTMPSAISVASIRTLSPQSALEAVANLAAKSLLTADASGDIVNYRLLDVTRAYASEKLKATDETDEVYLRHATQLLDSLQRADSEWTDRPASEWRKAFGFKVDDIRAALEWAFSSQGMVSLGVALTAVSSTLWFQLSLLDENRKRLEYALGALKKLSIADPLHETQLNVAYGHVLWHTTGRTDLMAEAFDRALCVAKELGSPYPQLLPLWGLWTVKNLKGEYTEAVRLAERHGELSRELNDQKTVLIHERMMALSLHMSGEHETAKRYAEHVLSHAVTVNDAARNSDFQFDQRVATRTLIARILWIQGFPDQAAVMAKACVEDAIAADHTLSLCYAISMAGCPVNAWIGDLDSARHFADVLFKVSARHSLAYWHWWARCHKLALGCSDDRAETGDDWKQSLRGIIFKPQHVETLATYRPELIDDEAVLRAENGKGGWSAPELLRANGENILKGAGDGAMKTAELIFLRAINLAHDQGALSWELRAATSLAQVWHNQQRSREAYDMLAATYGRFTEGFGTADLKRAADLLCEMRGSP